MQMKQKRGIAQPASQLAKKKKEKARLDEILAASFLSSNKSPRVTAVDQLPMTAAAVQLRQNALFLSFESKKGLRCASWSLHHCISPRQNSELQTETKFGTLLLLLLFLCDASRVTQISVLLGQGPTRKLQVMIP